MKSIVIFSNRTYNYLQLTQHPHRFLPGLDGRGCCLFLFSQRRWVWDGYTAGAEQRGIDGMRGMGWDGMGMMDGVGR